MTDINPYEAPKTPASPEVTNANTWRTAEFTIHTPEPHEVEIHFYVPTCLEIYRIDGVERLRRRNWWSFSSVQRFPIEGPTPCVLEIAVKYGLWLRASASLDGRLVIENLFPADRRRVMTTLVAILAILILAATALGALVWTGAAQDMLREWRLP